MPNPTCVRRVHNVRTLLYRIVVIELTTYFSLVIPSVRLVKRRFENYVQSSLGKFHERKRKFFNSFREHGKLYTTFDKNNINIQPSTLILLRLRVRAIGFSQRIPAAQLPIRSAVSSRPKRSRLLIISNNSLVFFFFFEYGN